MNTKITRIPKIPCTTTTIDSKKVKIKVQGKKEFNSLRELLTKFKPEVLNVKG